MGYFLRVAGIIYWGHEIIVSHTFFQPKTFYYETTKIFFNPD